MSKRGHLIAVSVLIWLTSAGMVAALYGADITGEAIARNIPAIRVAFVVGASINAALLALLLYLYSCKLKLAEELDRLLAKIRDDFAQIKILRGLLPLCCYCKKVRNDTGCWEQIEAYVTNNSHTRFSHGICPECMAKLVEDQTEPDVLRR